MKAWWAWVLLLRSAPALACDVDDCSAAPIVLPATDNVPVNAVAFEVVGNTQGLRMTDGDGAAIPASAKWSGPDQVWSPDVALQVGQQLRVTYKPECGNEVTRTLFVAAEASLDRASSAQLVDRSAQAPHGERRIYADLSYQPPSSAENFVRLRIEVDGLPYRSASYYAPYAFGELREQLWARCDAPPNPDTVCGGYDSLTARKHEVKLIARALGSDAEDTQTLDVDLRCEIENEKCQLGAAEGGWLWLALLLRRRRRFREEPRRSHGQRQST